MSDASEANGADQSGRVGTLFNGFGSHGSDEDGLEQVGMYWNRVG